MPSLATSRKVNTRAPKGEWTCQGGCRSHKPKAQFQLWTMITGYHEPRFSTRCNECMHTWPCRGGCQSRKHISHFQLWRSKTRSLKAWIEPTETTRCDVCILKQEEEDKKTKFVVDMFCPRCSEPRTFDMGMFWEPDEKQPFPECKV